MKEIFKILNIICICVLIESLQVIGSRLILSVKFNNNFKQAFSYYFKSTIDTTCFFLKTSLTNNNNTSLYNNAKIIAYLIILVGRASSFKTKNIPSRVQ